MSNIDDDLYLMSVSKIKNFEEEKYELYKQDEEINYKIYEINQFIKAEEKLLKELEKRKLKKNKIYI